MKSSRIFITCSKGIEPFLSKEVKALGFTIESEVVAGVVTEGTLADTMTLNLFLRTGHRVLYLLTEFRADNPNDLYRGIADIPWEDHIPSDGYICIASSVDMPDITDSRYANLKCKDAIVDRLRERCGMRPDSGPERDRTVVALYWKGSRCSVYIDTSGESLAKRGYRKIPWKAPMQETLAAAVIMSSGWSGSGHFINPMCGSGTLAIEAALIGLDRAPGLLRSNFGFMHLRGFEEERWKEMRGRAKASARRDLQSRIIATDISPEAIAAAQRNAATAGVDHLIEFRVCDYSDTEVPEGQGMVIVNPEYGERMGRLSELEPLYKGIGDFFKQKCRGYRGYIFTGNPGLAKRVGLRTKSRRPFFNSTIECRLLEYELYEGSRKQPHA